MKILIMLLLLILQLGIPGAELIFWLFSLFIPHLKVELLAEALEACRKLESIEKRYREFLNCCGPCAKDLLLSDVEFELAACRSEIKRLRRLESLDEINKKMLAIDLEALEQFQRQRREILALDEQELQQQYLLFLKEGVQEASVHFYRLAKVYKPSFSIEPAVWVDSRNETCTACSVNLYGLGMLTT